MGCGSSSAALPATAHASNVPFPDNGPEISPLSVEDKGNNADGDRTTSQRECINEEGETNGAGRNNNKNNTDGGGNSSETIGLVRESEEIRKNKNDIIVDGLEIGEDQSGVKDSSDAPQEGNEDMSVKAGSFPNSTVNYDNEGGGTAEKSAVFAPPVEKQHVYDPELNSELDKAVSALLSNVALEVEKEMDCVESGGDGVGDDDSDKVISVGNKHDDATLLGTERSTNDNDCGQYRGDGNNNNLPISCREDPEPLCNDNVVAEHDSENIITERTEVGNFDNDNSNNNNGDDVHNNDGDDDDTDNIKRSVSCGSDEPLPDLMAKEDGNINKPDCDNNNDNNNNDTGGGSDDDVHVRQSVSCGSDEPLPDLTTKEEEENASNVGGDDADDDNFDDVDGGDNNTHNFRQLISRGNSDAAKADVMPKEDENTNSHDTAGVEANSGGHDTRLRSASCGSGEFPFYLPETEEAEQGEENLDDPDGLFKRIISPKKYKQSQEEKKAKEAQKKMKKKETKMSVTSAGSFALEEFPTAPENNAIPLVVFKCVSHIEAEGLHTEGLYRISGNKSQGDLFLSQFVEDPNTDINSLGISINAIATLLKSFFNELSEPLIPSNVRDELMEAAEMSDKSGRLLMLRGVIKKLPEQNYELLKYVITHLYRVSQNQEHNSMGSSNLAKCWWPTLLRLEFKSYEKMIQGTQIPEDIVHALIEQAQFFFYGGNEV